VATFFVRLTFRGLEVTNQDHPDTRLLDEGAELGHQVVDDAPLVTVFDARDSNTKVIKNDPAAVATTCQESNARDKVLGLKRTKVVIEINMTTTNCGIKSRTKGRFGDAFTPKVEGLVKVNTHQTESGSFGGLF